ncbi:MAG: hypothetical protein IIY55_13040 [Blautia sp.]|nr:hypothetical protein [Blautia sp.]
MSVLVFNAASAGYAMQQEEEISAFPGEQAHTGILPGNTLAEEAEPRQEVVAADIAETFPGNVPAEEAEPRQEAVTADIAEMFPGNTLAEEAELRQEAAAREEPEPVLDSAQAKEEELLADPEAEIPETDGIPESEEQMAPADSIGGVLPEVDHILTGNLFLDAGEERKEEDLLTGGNPAETMEEMAFAQGGSELLGAGSVNCWIQGSNGSFFWVKEDGKILREGGWHILGGKRYFLANNSGRRKSEWITWAGKRYYLNPATGVLVTGFKSIDNRTYYFQETGSVPGRMMTGTVIVNNKQYFFFTSGAMKRGWRVVKNRKYYYGKDGAAYTLWHVIDGREYFFDKKTCVMKTGWLYNGRFTYYLEADGTKHTGPLNIGGKKYYFRENGWMLKDGWVSSGIHRYYYGADGNRLSGWRTIGQNTYYFNTKWGYATTGWLSIGGSRYYFDQNGVRQTGLLFIGGGLYYFDPDGRMIRNKTALKIGGDYYKIDGNGLAVRYTNLAEILAIQKLDEVGWDLYQAYKWCTITYIRNDDTVPDGYTPFEWFTILGFRQNGGDCYCMAGMFCQMALLLGEDAHFVMGSVPYARGGMGPHGWCEIDRNGATYICDPDFEYDTAKKGNWKNGYMITYGTPGTWVYTDGVRMN